MSPDEQAVMDAAVAWVQACERVAVSDGAEHLSNDDESLVEDAETTLMEAVHRWLENRFKTPANDIVH